LQLIAEALHGAVETCLVEIELWAIAYEPEAERREPR